MQYWVRVPNIANLSGGLLLRCSDGQHIKYKKFYKNFIGYVIKSYSFVTYINFK